MAIDELRWDLSTGGVTVPLGFLCLVASYSCQLISVAHRIWRRLIYERSYLENQCLKLKL